jgi:hypothetical protein
MHVLSAFLSVDTRPSTWLECAARPFARTFLSVDPRPSTWLVCD